MREFLSQKGVDFDYRNVDEDPAAMQELLDLGLRSTPVTLVGQEPILGFDRARLEEALDKLGS